MLTQNVYDCTMCEGMALRGVGTSVQERGEEKRMDPLRRAYCELMLARGVWRAAKDVEAQVAHWCLEGGASHADLVAARQRDKAAKAA